MSVFNLTVGSVGITGCIPVLPPSIWSVFYKALVMGLSKGPLQIGVSHLWRMEAHAAARIRHRSGKWRSRSDQRAVTLRGT